MLFMCSSCSATNLTLEWWNLTTSYEYPCEFCIGNTLSVCLSPVDNRFYGILTVVVCHLLDQVIYIHYALGECLKDTLIKSCKKHMCCKMLV